LSFIIWFNLFSMKLSWSHDLSYKFCRLAEVEFIRLNMSSSRHLKKEYIWCAISPTQYLKNVFNIQVLCSWLFFLTFRKHVYDDFILFLTFLKNNSISSMTPTKYLVYSVNIAWLVKFCPAFQMNLSPTMFLYTFKIIWLFLIILVVRN
jgi:hypothetical protein